MAFASRLVLCIGMSLLLAAPTTSQGQPCTIPTEQNVRDVANQIFPSSDPEGEDIQIQELLQVHFTCLARVAQDMYSSATVVATFTTTSSSNSTTAQYQLVCTSSAWTRSSVSGFKDPAALPAMPFAIETNYSCSQCEELQLSEQGPNYDPDSNCIREYMYLV